MTGHEMLAPRGKLSQAIIADVVDLFITRDLPERTVRDLFEAFLGIAAPDRPDRTALTENPLIPFGGG